MKKANTFLHAVSIVGLIVVGYIMFQRNIKVAYVDNNVIMQNYQGLIDARSNFDTKAEEWKKQTDTLMQQWQDDLKAYEKERATMTKKERELKEELLRNKQQQINQFRMATEQKTKEEEQKLLSEVLVVVNKFIKEYGKQNGYTYILGANGSGNILYAKESKNITNDILEKLNHKYNK